MLIHNQLPRLQLAPGWILQNATFSIKEKPSNVGILPSITLRMAFKITDFPTGFSPSHPHVLYI